SGACTDQTQTNQGLPPWRAPTGEVPDTSLPAGEPDRGAPTEVPRPRCQTPRYRPASPTEGPDTSLPRPRCPTPRYRTPCYRLVTVQRVRPRCQTPRYQASRGRDRATGGFKLARRSRGAFLSRAGRRDGGSPRAQRRPQSRSGARGVRVTR